MTLPELTIAVAKIDGYEWKESLNKGTWAWFHTLDGKYSRWGDWSIFSDENWEVLPNYSESHDCILPVIRKVINTPQLQKKFSYALYDIFRADHGDTYIRSNAWTWLAIMSTPEQLCRALVKTIGEPL